jgi:thiol-disulfide isomerase/thioredoxin
MRLNKILPLLLFLSIVSTFVSSQSIKVVNFKDFKPYLEKDNDSLYIINFWATWCKPCVEEMPAFERINREFKNEKVKVLLVSLDFPDQVNTRLKRYLEVNKIKSEVIVLDEPNADKWINQVSGEWSGALPGTLFYRNSKREFYEQKFSYQELNSIVKTFLK